MAEGTEQRPKDRLDRRRRPAKALVLCLQNNRANCGARLSAC
jgi:hypothetical protein